MNKINYKEILKNNFPLLGNGDIDLLIDQVDYVHLEKGEILVQSGSKHAYFYLILKGGVKSYCYKEGREVCLWFAFEKDIVGTIKTVNGAVSNETIKLLEATEFIRFNINGMQQLALSKLSISQLMMELIIDHAEFLEERLFHLQFASSKERYKVLYDAVPELFNRVSLTDIASFLGVSRETLSRIRAQK